MKFTKKSYLLIIAAIALLWMLKDSFTQPGETDLKGNFKELTFARNEQNTGPVFRVYSVNVDDTLWNEMEDYGNLKPHTKYGNTRVYYFIKGTPTPDKLSTEGDNIQEQYKRYCIARYEKNAMGQTFLSRYPFSN